ncbi:hypothetical protein [Renibacterium salmoninarum]|uniref:hypothetical protein n=1 Tax=Renibacterium salmoninarum TaxID=1646 RepID=UPI0002FA9A24|nr:hypothetical protein [Renibacterium salmoninarum]
MRRNLGRRGRRRAAHPLLGQIPALKKGAYAADMSKTLNLAWAVSLEKFVPELVKAVDAAGKK